MKLRKFAWMLVLAMLVVGCGKETEEEPSVTPEINIEINTGETENSENTENTDTPTKGVYDDFIAYVRELILNEPIKLLDTEGLSGIGESILSSSDAVTESNLAKLGYYVEDLNGDDIPELMFGRTDDKKMIFSLYTLVNGEPTVMFEGYYKNMYQWLGEGRFFYSGTGGSIYSMFGTYNLEGTELVCEEYYFTHEKDESFTEIGYYHNTSGVDDITVSEEMAEADFWPTSNTFREKTREIEWTPFGE